MLKGLLWIILFVFFVILFFVLLSWSIIVKTIKNLRRAAQDAADLKEQRMRDEVGRQRQQYSQRQQPRNAQSTQNAQSAQYSHQNTQQERPEQENARRTQTATGETIIDHHHEKRENRKIFDDSDGEYVEFEEA